MICINANTDKSVPKLHFVVPAIVAWSKKKIFQRRYYNTRAWNIRRKFLFFFEKLNTIKSVKMSDWDTVPITLRKRVTKGAAAKSEKAVNTARRQGVAVDTQVKWGGGANKQHITTKNTAKLDRETDELKHDTIPLDLGKLIQQGRSNKGLSQKDLATKVNEKAQVINDYEAGRGIPNQMVISKIERVLGIKLRGKDRGQPLLPPGSKK